MRNLRFTILCNNTERNLIKEIANKLLRSQGDTIRFLIYKGAEEYLSGEKQDKSLSENLKRDIYSNNTAQEK